MNREDLIQEIVESIAKCQRPANFSTWQEIGLSHAQLGMLFMLSYHRKLQVKQIAEYLGISKSAASQVVTPLAAKGFVERPIDSQDRRIVHLTLTTVGIKALKQLHKFKFAGIRSAVNNLNDKEISQFHGLCQKMAANTN
jgi:DNA-binding MarR family transcriptional regulator